MAFTTIDDSTQHHDTVCWSGNSVVGRKVSGYNFQPDLLFVDLRNAAENNSIWDSTRGDKHWRWDQVGNESTTSMISSYDTYGMTLTNQSQVNNRLYKYVAAGWKANGASRTTFTESGNNPGGGRQVNTTAGLSIIDYTGTGGNGTIAHGLGVTPNWVIVRNRDGGNNDANFDHFTGLLSADDRILYGSSTDGQTQNASAFNSTAPTSTNITVGTNSGTNKDGDNYIMYAFANIQGFSKIGKYNGNGNALGPFIYTGFRPGFLITKRFDQDSDGWRWGDDTRPIFDGNTVNDGSLPQLKLNAEESESSSGARNVQFVSNGFHIMDTDGDTNASNGTYIYCAFASAPFVTSNGGANNAS